jgi:branched-chain amino acid transport system substrate-binding protein
MKRTYALLSVLAVAGLILAACATPTAAPTVPPAAGATTPPEPVAFECTDAIGCLDVAPGDPIHLAYALTVSGATATLGEDSKGAIEIAIDDVGGELLGHPIELTGEDTLSAPRAVRRPAPSWRPTRRSPASWARTARAKLAPPCPCSRPPE